MHILLDVTRLVSRIGQSQLTGVDRVERAYLDFALGLPRPLFFYRSTRGYVLLGAEGGRALARFADGEDLPARGDILSHLIWRGRHPRHRLQAALRKFALARCPHFTGLSRMISAHVPSEAVYLNVGHANLSPAVFEAVQPRKVLVYVHDVIPLTHPQFTRAGIGARFEQKLSQVGRYADAILTNSNVSKQAICDWFYPNPSPPCHVLYPGLDHAKNLPLPRNPQRRFLMIGTIEPRKNHALLLDTWDALFAEMGPDDCPELHLVGQRGWAAPDLLQRLDQHLLRNTKIFEHGALPDAELRDLMQSANALLFPSLAEGFGYPPLEALQVGLPCIVSDLPVHREVLKTYAIFLSPLDPQAWKTQIKEILLSGSSGLASPMDDLPNWKDHFRAVQAVISDDVRE